MVMTNDASQMDNFSYAVKWKGTTLGYIKDVDPSGLKRLRKEKKVGNFGPVVVGRVNQGMSGSIKCTLHQAKVATIKALCAWWSSGPVPLTPSSMTWDDYAHADLLTLHPYGLDDAVTDDDINYLKAFPNFTPSKADGDAWRELDVEWDIYPDLTQLGSGNHVYGYYGAPPSGTGTGA